MKRIVGKVIGIALVALAALGSAQVQAQAKLATNKHNLSVSGPGTVKATSATETQTCIFCHVPHAASTVGPLWNRNNPTAAYTQYTSSTTRGTMGQPNGSSLLCLGCHDGTVALGELLSRGATRVAIANTAAGTGVMLAGANPYQTPLLGTDLSNDHPVSFAYNAALFAASGGELANPTTLTGVVKLDTAGRLQCRSCHDPHNDTNGKFLVMNNTASALCVACHTRAGWSASSHATSAATWSGTGTNPWLHTSGTTVSANACENCHQPHTAAAPTPAGSTLPGRQRLLNSSVSDEANCYTCHTGTVAALNMQTEVTKASAHAVANYANRHDPVEVNVVPTATRHVECVDCHNPHRTNATAGTTQTASGAPTLPGALNGVRGISIAGADVNPVSFEYETCLRCHGDSTGKHPAGSFQPLTRVIAQDNVRLEFQTTNSSYHPVAGNNPSALPQPSLIAPLTTNSRITCSACHSNNTIAGPKGPHGSTVAPLLKYTYTFTDNTTESATEYALCYSCHSRTSILSNAVGSFREHNKHIFGERAPCSVCHDAHGVAGVPLNNVRLMNFRTPIVTASPGNGAIRWARVGAAGGSCYLTCHGKDHNPLSY